MTQLPFPSEEFMRTFHALVAAAIFGLLFVGATTAANAAVSRQGDDFTQDYNDRDRIRTCDNESDSTPVKGEYDTAGLISGGTVYDSDGNNGVCAHENPSSYILRHQTCEYRSFWPDECGNWQDT
jgi:hypothetical protein